jgi:hypothetical protein
MVLFYTVRFWVAELFWQNSAEAELGRTSRIRPNPNFAPNFGASLIWNLTLTVFMAERSITCGKKPKGNWNQMKVKVNTNVLFEHCNSIYLRRMKH